MSKYLLIALPILIILALILTLSFSKHSQQDVEYEMVNHGSAKKDKLDVSRDTIAGKPLKEESDIEDDNINVEKVYMSMIDIMNKNSDKSEFKYQDKYSFLKLGNLFEPAKIHAVLVLYTSIVTGDVYILEKRDGKWMELLKCIEIDKDSGIEVTFSDCNGDGYPDLLVRAWFGATGNIGFHLWLYNYETGNISYIPEFCGLSQPHFDISSKILHTTCKGGCAGTEYTYIDYIWDEHTLVPIREVEETYNGEKEKWHIKIYERTMDYMVLIRDEDISEPYFPH